MALLPTASTEIGLHEALALATAQVTRLHDAAINGETELVLAIAEELEQDLLRLQVLEACAA